MWLIVGLANGPGFEHTRHSVGWTFIDAVSARYGLEGEVERDNARVVEGSIGGSEVLLVKPLTLMNSSGEPVKALADAHSVAVDNVLVLHDDLDYPAGQLRIKSKGGHGRHGGLRSLIDCLGSGDFARVRLGIGRPPAGESIYDYVLSPPSADDNKRINEALALAAESVETVVNKGVTIAMNDFNRRGSGG